MVGTIRHDAAGARPGAELDELRQVWAATADDTPYSHIVRLLILTGCRREEIGGLMWDEVDGDVVHLPAAR